MRADAAQSTCLFMAPNRRRRGTTKSQMLFNLTRPRVTPGRRGRIRIGEIVSPPIWRYSRWRGGAASQPRGHRKGHRACKIWARWPPTLWSKASARASRALLMGHCANRARGPFGRGCTSYLFAHRAPRYTSDVHTPVEKILSIAT